MDEDNIALFLEMNEPAFDVGGKQYSVCCPANNLFATWDSDGNTFDFPDVTALLDEWMIGGKPFRSIVQTIM